MANVSASHDEYEQDFQEEQEDQNYEEDFVKDDASYEQDSFQNESELEINRKLDLIDVKQQKMKNTSKNNNIDSSQASHKSQNQLFPIDSKLNTSKRNLDINIESTKTRQAENQTISINNDNVRQSIQMFKTDDSLVNLQRNDTENSQHQAYQNQDYSELDKMKLQQQLTLSNQEDADKINLLEEQENLNPDQQQQIISPNQKSLIKDQNPIIRSRDGKVQPLKPVTAVGKQRNHQSVHRSMNQLQQQQSLKNQSTQPIQGSQPKKFININQPSKKQQPTSRPQTSNVQTAQTTTNKSQRTSYSMIKSTNRNTSSKPFSTMIQSQQLNQHAQQQIQNNTTQKIRMMNQTQDQIYQQQRTSTGNQVGVRERLKQIIQTRRNTSQSQQRMTNNNSRSISQLKYSDSKQSMGFKPKLDLNMSQRQGGGADHDTRIGSTKRFSTDSFILQSQNNQGHNQSVQRSRLSMNKLTAANQNRQSLNQSNYTNRITSAGMNSTRSNFIRKSVNKLPQENPTTSQSLQHNVKSIKIADYYNADPRESLILKNELKSSASNNGPLDRMLRLSQDAEFPIKILDNIIGVEEQLYGFSLYNRGQELKKSLIDPNKVREYIQNHQQHKTPSKQSQRQAEPGQNKKDQDDWQQTLKYFKENPAALLEAIPTPRQDDDEDTDSQFNSAFTPKKRFDFLFNNGSSALGMHKRGNSQKNLLIMQQGTPTSRSRLASPKTNPLLSSRKLIQSASRTGLKLLGNTNTTTFGQDLRPSSSRQSLVRSPSQNDDSFHKFNKDQEIKRIYGGNDNSDKLKLQSPMRKNNFEKKDFRITKQLRNIQSASNKTRVQQDQNRTFNDSHHMMKDPAQERKQQRLKQLEDQQKSQNERKVMQNRLKQKIKTDYFDSKENKPLSSFKNSIQQSENFSSGKTLLPTLDWKTSKIYQEYIIQRKNNKQIFEQQDNKVFREDEIDYVKSMIGVKANEHQQYNEETNRLCTPFIQKAYNTLEILLKELLQNDFNQEFDKIYVDKSFGGSMFEKLQYLLERMRSLFRVREEILEFLFKVYEREVILEEMKKTVMNIKSEKDIEDELFIKPSKSQNGLGEQSHHEQQEKPTRDRIQKLGDSLVELTDDVQKLVKKFIQTFNKSMDFVRIEHFVFEEADYELISYKEVKEIKDIFRAFDIKIKDLATKKNY